MKSKIQDVISDAIGKAKRSRFRIAFFSAYLAFSLFSFVWFLSLGQVRNALLPIGYCAVFMLLLPVFEGLLSMECPPVFLLILFSVPVGGILGTCYDFYMLIPVFDDILHGISGFIFAALGYAIMERILIRVTERRRLASILFAIAFSLAIAVLWEMFEWALTAIMNGDMQEDSLVNKIHSYLLSGTHIKPVDITNIDKTIIIYDGGKTYVIEGGYLDLGLLDTLNDMLVCLAGALGFLAVGVFDFLSGKGALRHFVPQCNAAPENDNPKRDI